MAQMLLRRQGGCTIVTTLASLKLGSTREDEVRRAASSKVCRESVVSPLYAH
jgi:hypothetical protein